MQKIQDWATYRLANAEMAEAVKVARKRASRLSGADRNVADEEVLRLMECWADLDALGLQKLDQDIADRQVRSDILNAIADLDQEAGRIAAAAAMSSNTAKAIGDIASLVGQAQGLLGLFARLTL